MTLALRQQAVVDRNHTVHLQNAELVPGARVEVIVLVEAAAKPVQGKSISFLASARQHAIDAPPDFSVTFEDNLYGTGLNVADH